MQTNPDGTDVLFEDLTFDEHLSESNKIDHNNKKIVSKRSLSEHNVPDINDTGADAADEDDANHWLWGSVKRLKRSLTNLLHSGEHHEANHKPEIRRRAKPHLQKRKRSHSSTLRLHKQSDRSKRQDTEYEELDDDDEDHLNGGSGQGVSNFDVAEWRPNEQGARLCKCFVGYFMPSHVHGVLIISIDFSSNAIHN